MNIEDLKIKLITEKIDPNAYSLNGGLPNEKYCIERNNEKWEVYYSERGNKSGLKIFDSESEACLYMFSLVKPS